MPKLESLKAILLPGLVFQSTIIGGGYTSGRELVEFFLQYGPVAGYFGFILTFLIFTLVLIVSFEFARITKSYDYKTFFQCLIGRFWFLYEFFFFITLMIVVSVCSSLAGEIITQSTGQNEIVGMICFICIVTLVSSSGTERIESVMSLWSVALYGTYFLFFLYGIEQVTIQNKECLFHFPDNNDWLDGATTFAVSSLAAVPVILFSLRSLKNSCSSILAGISGSLLAIAPGLAFYTIMLGFYPEIIDDTIPLTRMMTAINAPFLSSLFPLIIFGTLIETCSALLHTFNERISEARKKKISSKKRAAITFLILMITVFVADKAGLLYLIAKGYRIISWIFYALFLIPLLTAGIKVIINKNSSL